MIVSGGCHCGAVRFEAEVDQEVELLDCNCSICSRTGFLHLIVPESRFSLVTGESELTSYRFGTGTAEHLFCSRCGVKAYYRPRSHPDCFSVNFRCLDEGHDLHTSVTLFDGRDWDKAREGLVD